MEKNVDSPRKSRESRRRPAPAGSTVAVIGLGYIGLPTAATLAVRGLRVIGVDIKEDIVQTVNSGNPHIEEPELDVLVTGSVAAGRLRATLGLERADAYLIAVPTPLDHATKKPILEHVEDACRSVARLLEPGSLVVIESTIPVGTTRKMCRLLAELRPDLRFPHEHADNPDVCVAMPGRVIRELVENDRVIGGSPRSAPSGRPNFIARSSRAKSS